MENYKSNSHRTKAANSATIEKKKVTAVTKAKIKKKSKIVQLLPVLKKAAVDAERVIRVAVVITDGINALLHGELPGNPRPFGSSYVSYNKIADRFAPVSSTSTSRYDASSSRRAGLNTDDVIMSSMGEATEVLEQMEELIEIYGVVSVGDFLDIVDLTGDYTDNNYGWTNLSRAEPVRIREGWVLKLPKARPIN